MEKLEFDRSSFKITLAVLIHFVAFATLHTIPFVLGHVWFPTINEHLNFPLERWFIWVLPSLVMIILFQKDLYVNLKEMFFNKVKLKTLAWCFLPLLAYLLGGLILVKYTGFGSSRPLVEFTGINEFLSTFLENSWGVLVVPAIPEEMVFRAWIQNVLLGKLPDKKRVWFAIIMSSLLFVIIHLPTFFYSYSHYSIWQMIGHGIVVFVLGSAFGLMFFKSKNILVPIGAHWLWDVFSGTFF